MPIRAFTLACFYPTSLPEVFPQLAHRLFAASPSSGLPGASIAITPRINQEGAITIATRLICLLLHGFIILAHAGHALGIDFNIRGQWVTGFGYGGNGAFEGKYRGHVHTGWGAGQDSFEVKDKFTLQLGAVASDALAGTLGIETGDIVLGQNASGGALGADQRIVKVNNAYIDAAFPSTDIKARMGIFGLSTPAVASGNSVYNGTAAGIIMTTPLFGDLNATIFWARLYNDNYPGRTASQLSSGFLDNVDTFAFLLPLMSDALSLTPWVLYAASGPNAFRSGYSPTPYAFGDIMTVGGANIYRSGMFPVGGARHRDFGNANLERRLNSYGEGWWAGITGNIRLIKDLHLSCDLEYGSVAWPDDARLSRQGWFASLVLEYLFDWGNPGLYFWHSSGDDGNPANGSERMPSLDGDDSINYSHFAFNGSPYIERNSLIGSNLGGTWGIGARLLQAEFVQNISHDFRVNLISGSNSPTMAKKMSLAGLWANGTELIPNTVGIGASLGMPNLYMTTSDKVLEISTSTTFKLYNEFLVCIEGAYAALWLDTSADAWGARHRLNQSIPQTRDAWNTNVSFVFSF